MSQKTVEEQIADLAILTESLRRVLIQVVANSAEVSKKIDDNFEYVNDKIETVNQKIDALAQASHHGLNEVGGKLNDLKDEVGGNINDLKVEVGGKLEEIHTDLRKIEKVSNYTAEYENLLRISR